jgi:multidrug efflux pump subunit AcrB
MSLSETDRLVRLAEKDIRDTPEVDNYSRRTGMQLGGGLTEANEGDLFIHLKPQPRRSIDEVMREVRARIEADVPGLQIETLQLMEDLIGDLTAVPQPIEVKLFGDDLPALQSHARRLKAALARVPGIVEVQDGNRESGDAIDIRIDPALAAIEGLDASTITTQLSTLLEGNVVGQVQAGHRLIGVRLQATLAQRDRIERLGDLRLHSPRGYDFPLHRVASIVLENGQPQIARENLAQMVAVTARIEQGDLGSAMKRVRALVHAQALPAGIRIEYGGLWAEQQKSFLDLAAVLGAGVLLVTALLMYLYERIAIVASIVATVFLSMTAVVIGLRVTGTALDISSLMGMTMIVGMVTEIAIFYFAEVDFASAPGPRELIHAGAHRLRPILMTTLIAILALAPLAVGLGSGSAMQKPLAVAIISGLIAALPLVLLVMPAMFLWFSAGSAHPQAQDRDATNAPEA